jgi:hypothetical protein
MSMKVFSTSELTSSPEFITSELGILQFDQSILSPYHGGGISAKVLRDQ